MVIPGRTERRPLLGHTGLSVPVLLFAVLGAPVAWAIHFGVIYFVVAAACAAGRTGIALPIGIATAGAAAISIGSGVVARRQRGALDDRERAASGHLLLIVGMLGAAFFTVLILLEALPPLFLPICPPGET